MIDFAGRVHAEGVNGTLKDVHEREALGLFVQADGAEVSAVARHFHGNGAGGETAAGKIRVIVHAIIVDGAVGIGGIGSGNLHGTDHDAVLIDKFLFAYGQRLKQVGILFQIQRLGHGIPPRIVRSRSACIILIRASPSAIY